LLWHFISLSDIHIFWILRPLIRLSAPGRTKENRCLDCL